MKSYEKPSMETIFLAKGDVITASIEDVGNPGQIFPGKKNMSGTWTDPNSGSDFE